MGSLITGITSECGEANAITHKLHTSSENRRKQERLFEKEILPLGLKIKEYEPEKK